MIHAAIDLGTNAVRFMVAEELNHQQIRILHRERMVVRLGEGFGWQKKILPESLRRAADALRKFSAEATRLRAARIRLIGTSVFRQAENREAACRQLEQESGLAVQVISGEMEAGLASYGVIKTLGLAEQNLIITDIGGGSTEVIYFPPEGGSPFFLSLPLGAVWLSERFLIHDPPQAGEWEEMIRFCRSVIEQRITTIFPNSKTTFVGTGGTASTVAAIEQQQSSYHPEQINNFTLPLASLEELAGRLCALPLVERRKICGLEKGREDIIPAGVAILLTLMRTLNISHLVISDAGLLEGIIWHEISPAPFLEAFAT